MRPNDKIMAVADLAEVNASLRSERKKTVHCHGVFDLLHIGHIRYLQKAKSLGDILIVTVTPDRFVNKGPHRPAFPEQLRVEAIASLDCVDYVALNEWPTAVETLGLLKPEVYAKGAEFRDNRTPEILREEAAASKAGTEIAFVEEITSSSSQLLNKYLSPFSEEVDRYLIELTGAFSPSQVLGYLRQAEPLKVLVVGETIIDEYYYCQTMGRSSKAPIVAMQYLSHERFVGGAAAVANHLAGFCREVALVSMVGAEDNEEDWIRKHLKPNVNARFLRKTGAPSIIKRRFRESYFALPVFELYIMNDSPLEDHDSEALCDEIRSAAGECDLTIAADCGHGMLTQASRSVLCRDDRFLAVNTQMNAANMGHHTISKYPRADYVCLADQELRLECRSRSGDLHAMLQDVARSLETRRIVVTRGKFGCLCLEGNEDYHEAPALATQVVDRVGAGDAFLAMTSLCAVQEAPMEVLAFLGNVAGAEAVATVGNREALEMLPFCRHVESLLK